MDELKQMLLNIKEELKKDNEKNRIIAVNNIEEIINGIKVKVELHDRKIEFFEKEFKKRNIIIYGFKELVNENYDVLEKEILAFFKDSIKIDCTVENIDFIKRLGVKKNDTFRPVIVGFTTWRMKRLVLLNSKKLKGSSLVISEDFPHVVVKKRRELVPQMLEARRNGKFAILKYDRLIVEDFKARKEYNKGSRVKLQLSYSPKALEKEEGGTELEKELPISRHQIYKRNKTICHSMSADMDPGKITSFLRRSDSLGSLNLEKLAENKKNKSGMTQATSVQKKRRRKQDLAIKYR